MSSFVRRVQQERNGWGSKLGVHNADAYGSSWPKHPKIAYVFFPPPARPKRDVEAHHEKMKRKWAERALQPPGGFGLVDLSYRKSIWPKGKTASPARMGVN